MSEPTCPNCGSAPVARGKNNRFQDDGIFVCRTAVYAGRQIDPTPACELIRSLREELAEARGLAISMAYELKCSFTDMDCDGECANAGCGSCYPCKLHVQAKALRNNEHRSDT